MIINNFISCRNALSFLLHRVQVLFAHELTLLTLHIFEKHYPDNPDNKNLYNCLDLVFKWIINSNSVKKEKLLEIANRIYEESHTILPPTIDLFYATANTAFATNVVDTTYATACAAHATAYVISYIKTYSYKNIEDSYKNIEDSYKNIEDTFNQCYCPDLTFDDNWKTSTVVELAKTIFNNNALDLCPILADALEDAGCTEIKVLDRLRNAAILRSEWILWNLLDLGKNND